eukprot:jgi/Chlat1/4420/Chrsp29S04546
MAWQAVARQLARRRWLVRDQAQTSAFAPRSSEPVACCQAHAQVAPARMYSKVAPPAGAAPFRKTSPVTWLSFGLLALTTGGLVVLFDRERQKKLQAVTSTASVGQAAIGGPFKLIDHNGNAFSDKDLLGKWSLLYFGFTLCPDICPDELVKMSEALNLIEKRCGVKIFPVFISVDPDRDTVQRVAEYVKDFHPRLVGLTGSVESVKEAARAYRVYYTKTDETKDYLVDHSIIMYLVNPQGEFVKFFGKNNTAAALADQVCDLVKQP